MHFSVIAAYARIYCGIVIYCGFLLLALSLSNCVVAPIDFQD